VAEAVADVIQHLPVVAHKSGQKRPPTPSSLKFFAYHR
jgi:hypothetical protein